MWRRLVTAASDAVRLSPRGQDGVILGEAILPVTVFALLGLLYWRDLWLATAAVLLVIVTPVLLILQRGIV